MSVYAGIVRFSCSDGDRYGSTAPLMTTRRARRTLRPSYERNSVEFRHS
jgi:hypothetical protein